MGSKKKENAISVDDLWFSYGKKPILKKIRLEIKAGEICAVVGPNGAGKSTLFNAIAGILQPERGKIEINLGDEKLSDAKAHQLAKKGLGYVMQGARVLPSLSVLEHLEIGISELKTTEKKKRVEEVLDFLPVLGSLLSHRVGMLSGGERQILALGTQIVRRPKILLLDEPSAGLSNTTSAEHSDTMSTEKPKTLTEIVFSLFVKLNLQWKTTIAIIEHNFNPTFEIADRILVVEGGNSVRVIDRPKNWLKPEAQNELFTEKYSLTN